MKWTEEQARHLFASKDGCWLVNWAAKQDAAQALIRAIDIERERAILQSDKIKELLERNAKLERVAREALEGIAWSAGSNTATILPSIKRRAEEALAALEETP
jgi:hypothetical protein